LSERNCDSRILKPADQVDPRPVPVVGCARPSLLVDSDPAIVLLL
jgi:hypothetical protein